MHRAQTNSKSIRTSIRSSIENKGGEAEGFVFVILLKLRLRLRLKLSRRHKSMEQRDTCRTINISSIHGDRLYDGDGAGRGRRLGLDTIPLLYY